MKEQNKLILKDVNLKFGIRNREKIIFDNFNLTIENGLTAISAPSGKGKSTLLKIIKKENRLTSGEVIFNEKEIVSIYDYKNKLISIDKTIFNPNLTVYENLILIYYNFINLNNQFSFEEINNKVLNFIKELKIENLVDTKIKSLSLGEITKLCLFLSRIGDYDIYLFDEPLTGLDSSNFDFCFNFLLNLSENKIVIFTKQSDSYPEKYRNLYKEVSL